MKKLLIILLCFICLTGCSNNSDSEDDGLISYVDAKEQLINNGAILIDVRTEEEYNARHIDGAILLPLDTISEEAVADVIETKDTTIIVYCRSGNRSHQAMEQLKSLGYEDVYDLGSIDNWEE